LIWGASLANRRSRTERGKPAHTEIKWGGGDLLICLDILHAKFSGFPHKMEETVGELPNKSARVTEKVSGVSLA
jgi:hypothetical protein